MALAPGTRLGHDDVTSLLGEGGLDVPPPPEPRPPPPPPPPPVTTAPTREVSALLGEGGMRRLVARRR